MSATTAADKVHRLVAPLLADLSIEVSDVELGGGLLRVTVERADGASIDLAAIAEATRIVSRELDVHDPVPGRYTLEVSSPGLERPLRTPAHFARAVGQQVSVRTQPSVDGERRVAGLLTSADSRWHRRDIRRQRRPGPPRARLRRHRACSDRVRVGTAAEGAQTEKRGAAQVSICEGDRAMSTGNPDMMDALKLLAAEKGISVDVLLQALADALASAYKRMPGAADEAEVEIDAFTGDIRVMAYDIDEEGNWVNARDDTPDDFGRIAAQTAKQVMGQRIREAERERKYEEYAGREGDIVTGIIQQSDQRYTLLDLGKVEALLPQAEQVPYERPEPSTRLKAYIVEVRRTSKGPQIVVSRTHPGLIKRLFELEVPEIVDGVVEIKACAREPGHRTKIAVWSNDHNVDPVGACVGARGAACAWS